MAGIDIPVSLSDGLTSPFESMGKAVAKTYDELEKLKKLMEQDFSSPLSDVGNKTQDNTRYQQQHNQALRDGEMASNGLLGKIKGIAGAYLGFMGAKKLINIGDAMAGNDVRISMINDGLETNLDLNKKIYEMALRTRTSYIDTSAVVGKLGLLAGDAFSGNDELLRFTELLNKSFKISGASAMEQKSAMYQLTQAMASGRLQGDEFNSIRENAPMLAQAIQKELDGIDMKKASAQGLITNDVIKRAMFNLANEIEGRYNKMPMTFSGIAQNIATNFIVGMSPLWSALSRLWNNQYIKSFVEYSIVAFTILGHVAGAIIDFINGGITLIGNNWQWLGPIIYGVVGALVLYKGALIACAIYQNALCIAQGIYTGIMIAYTVLTGSMTLAQWGFNAALLACPITWIIGGFILFIALIYAGVGAYNKLTGAHISATGLIAGSFMALITMIYNAVVAIMNFILLVIQGIVNAFILGIDKINKGFLMFQKFVLTVARNVTACFDSVATNIANAMVDGANMAIRAINWIIEALNKIPGVDIGTMSELSHTSSITHTIDNRISQIDSQLSTTPQTWTAPQIQYKGVKEAFDKGYNFGEGLAKKVGGVFGLGDKKEEADKFDPSKYLGENANSPLGGGKGGKALKDTAKNTKKIAENTDTSKLDVKYLREMAERQAINRFTTAQITIENNISNPNTSDLDGFVDHLNTTLTEKMDRQTEGYYTA